MTQCGTKDINRSFSSDQTNRLLSADAEKAWILVSRIENGENVYNDCLENNSLTFVHATTEDSLYVLGRATNCGSTTTIDTLYKAKYTLDANDNEIFQNTISLTDESHQSIESIQVGELTSSILKVSYTANGRAIQESYSY
ncbi:hypothetical protein SAMN04488029_1345 [Reichenbachiella faecimaris]|uniref:Lipocalin-like domain-containing protein n=1 Tax=Reichenbachiella faecimaris TaxID=692418 RepID=A0A1W2G910_REIFA|nr:hypothetical protein [Reichenbachiella faecimaris]SMD32984.1 hypothetical protein SAMN04488029_1345 [Reichenbachiella faecimaris]